MYPLSSAFTSRVRCTLTNALALCLVTVGICGLASCANESKIQTNGVDPVRIENLVLPRSASFTVVHPPGVGPNCIEPEFFQTWAWLKAEAHLRGFEVDLNFTSFPSLALAAQNRQPNAHVLLIFPKDPEQFEELRETIPFLLNDPDVRGTPRELHFFEQGRAPLEHGVYVILTGLEASTLSCAHLRGRPVRDFIRRFLWVIASQSEPYPGLDSTASRGGVARFLARLKSPAIDPPK